MAPVKYPTGVIDGSCKYFSWPSLECYNMTQFYQEKWTAALSMGSFMLTVWILYFEFDCSVKIAVIVLNHICFIRTSSQP
jgi:hypothetical protein